MAQQLGSGVNKAAIYTRGGGAMLLPLTKVTGLEWGRARNVFSTAAVTISNADEVYDQLGQVHSWAHELVIFRDGRRVWEGPIRLPDFGSSDTVINAVDVLGWLSKRRIRLNRVIAEGDERKITTEMDVTLQRALNTDDPNVLDHRLTLHHSDEALITRDVKIASGLYDSDFTGMAGKGGNFTTVGRRVIIWPDEVLLGRLDTLVPERDTTGQVRVQENGDALATSQVAVNSDGKYRTVFADSTDVDGTTGVSDFYGKHDGLVSADDEKAGPGLTAIARAAVAQQFPAPLELVMPDDSQLKPTAPFGIEQLVPGVMVPIETSATPRRASATMILDSVKVTQGPEGESVSVTVRAASAYAGSTDADA